MKYILLSIKNFTKCYFLILQTRPKIKYHNPKFLCPSTRKTLKMCSSVSSPSFIPPSNKPFLFHHPFSFAFSVKPFVYKPRKPKPFLLLASTAEKNSTPALSWDKIDPDEYNGWAIAEVSPKPVKKKSLTTFVVAGIGASIAVFLGLVAYYSVSRKGFRFRYRYPESFVDSKSDTESERISSDFSLDDAEEPEGKLGGVSDAFVATEMSDTVMEERKERVIVPLGADNAQQEAILALKKLKIIEDDAIADELCTRREYARWLLIANSRLERSRKHRIIPSAALCGSRITAFDDVKVEDPDFEHIQSLAEAGVIRSKLSDEETGLNFNGVEGKKHVNFSPERYIAREDLISWKTRLEYEVMPSFIEEMSRKNIGFLDVKEISSDVLVELFVDNLADEKSILRGVFGQSKRLQPTKPCTKAQAAVALTSGRMTEFIKAELLRLEAENVSKQIEFKEVMSELLERGEIKKFWEQRIEEERSRGLKVEMDYREAIKALEQEKTSQEISFAEFLKQKAGLDCQNQLLLSLKAEVNDMSRKLDFERKNYIDERRGIEEIRNGLEVNYEGLLDKKSILEAELEALRILRSWVEDEALKSHARAKVLEDAERRWKWDGKS